MDENLQKLIAELPLNPALQTDIDAFQY